MNVKRERVTLLLLALVLTVVGWRGPAGVLAAPLLVKDKPSETPAEPAKEVQPLDLADKLASKVKTNMFDGESLADILDLLTKRYDIAFQFNHKAFDAEDLKEVEKTVVGEGRPIPAMNNVPLSKVLRTILARIPSQTPATYVIRDEGVEITTEAALRAELGRGENDPLLPLAQAQFDRVPLDEALKQLARRTGFNILLDVRVGDKAKVPVSASLKSVPLDTAVRLLADMATLQPVLIDNVLYVTNKENAQRLVKEEQERKGFGFGLGGTNPLAPKP